MANVNRNYPNQAEEKLLAALTDETHPDVVSQYLVQVALAFQDLQRCWLDERVHREIVLKGMRCVPFSVVKWESSRYATLQRKTSSSLQALLSIEKTDGQHCGPTLLVSVLTPILAYGVDDSRLREKLLAAVQGPEVNNCAKSCGTTR